MKLGSSFARALLGLLLAASLTPGVAVARNTIIPASPTTSVENSGLLAHILPQFTGRPASRCA